MDDFGVASASARNLMRINVAPVSKGFNCDGLWYEKPRGPYSKQRNLRPLGWAAFFLASLSPLAADRGQYRQAVELLGKPGNK